MGRSPVKLYLDANIVILGHEGDEPLIQAVLGRLWQWCNDGGSLVTSAFSRLECRVVPIRNRDDALLADFADFFLGDAVEIVEVSIPIIDRAAEFRAAHGFKSPDAIHFATAFEVGASRFFTADLGLHKCPGLEIELLPRPKWHPPLPERS